MVVDQPGATDPHRQHRERPRAPESLGIDHLGVVDFRERFSFELGSISKGIHSFIAVTCGVPDGCINKRRK